MSNSPASEHGGSAVIAPNPFVAVPVTAADREALYGGLISAGHPVRYARRQADGLPDDDGALQMLARYRLAFAEALDDLQQAEFEYRLMHDRHGDGSRAAGRAWDRMRRAGDRARAILDAAK